MRANGEVKQELAANDTPWRAVVDTGVAVNQPVAGGDNEAPLEFADWLGKQPRG